MKRLANIAVGGKIANLLAPLAAAPDAACAILFALTCPGRIEGTPPFAASPAPGPADPRGGLAAPVSLPLAATPYSYSEGQGGAE